MLTPILFDHPRNDINAIVLAEADAQADHVGHRGDDVEELADATRRHGAHALGVGYDVAIDSERDLWHDYGCEGWPSLFLWRSAGSLAWFHFGEGDYEESEHLHGRSRALAVAPVVHEGFKINLLDTPGYADYFANK